MALIVCPECGREISDQARCCPNCGYKPKPSKAPKPQLTPEQKKKRLLILLGAGILLVLLGVGYYFFSPWTFPWLCYHQKTEATCTEAVTCSRCGKTWGEPLGHQWQEATCTEPKICTVCGETVGEAKGHQWKEADCMLPKRCTVCGEKEGEALGHKWIAATCTQPETCSRCGKTRGGKEKHTVVDWICTQCGQTCVTKNDVPKIFSITSSRYEINSVGGINMDAVFRNESSKKTINYVTIDVSFYNAVGDILSNEIGGGTSVSLQYTGPLKPGATSGRRYWNACFYNNTFSGTLRINSIFIRYSDGTSLKLEEDVAHEAMVAWR